MQAITMAVFNLIGAHRLESGWRGEYLKQREDVAGQIDNSSTLGVRLSFDVNERLSSFENAQSVLEQSINSQMEDLVGVGFDYRATQKTSLTGEVFSEWRT